MNFERNGSPNRSAVVCWHTNSRRDIYDLFSFTHDLEENSRPDNLYSASTMSAQFVDYCLGCVISFTVKAIDNVDGANEWHGSRFSRNDSLEFSEFSLDIDHFGPRLHILDSFLLFSSFEIISRVLRLIRSCWSNFVEFWNEILKFLNFFSFSIRIDHRNLRKKSSWKKEFLEELKFEMRFLQSARTYLNSFLLIIWTNLSVAWTTLFAGRDYAFSSQGHALFQASKLGLEFSSLINLIPKWNFLAIPPCYSTKDNEIAIFRIRATAHILPPT